MFAGKVAKPNLKSIKLDFKGIFTFLNYKSSKLGDVEF